MHGNEKEGELCCSSTAVISYMLGVSFGASD